MTWHHTEREMAKRHHRPRLCARPSADVVTDTSMQISGKRATKRRPSWRKLHVGIDASTRESVATMLTTKDVDDASKGGPLSEQVERPLASMTADGAYDQDSIYDAVIGRAPGAAVILPPRPTAKLGAMAKTKPTQRDRHLQGIAEKGRIGWQMASGYNSRSRVKAAIRRYRKWLVMVCAFAH